ncbi:MAG TPA: MMPL family transporter [Candidatus Saccharimonadales bacterium]|nr:MMPL family transporter [Candidatus Saccharimonadales bacterium]
MKNLFRSRLWWWLLLIPLVLGVLRLRFDVEVLNLLPGQEPVVQGLKLYQQNFSNARELIITLEGAEPEGVETAARSVAEFLRTQSNLVTAVTWQPPWLEHPEQGAELIAYLWLNQSPELFGQLTNRLAPSNLATVLASARERLSTSFSPEDIGRLSYDPYDITRLPEKVSSGAAGFGQGQELFGSSNGTFRLMFVEARPDLTSYRECVRWFETIKQAVKAQANLLPKGVKLNYTGRPAFVSEIGGGMERDMGAPSAGTLVVIAILFYLTHRRWKPLFWLITLLILILAGALALGGFFYGTLNVVSLGFASILLGLAEDFGIVLYQESRTHPNLSPRQIRREAAPGIFWSALTTSGAFLLLNLSGLPGLGQLGSLVAIGIVLAAVVMLYAYLPPLLNKEQRSGSAAEDPHEVPQTVPRSRLYQPSIWVLTVLVLLAGVGVLVKYPPRFDKSPDALKPKNSEAYATLDEIKKQMNREQEPLWVMVKGSDEREIGRKLREIEPVLQKAVTNQLIQGFTLPNPLWPDADNQLANRAAASQLIGQKQMLREAAVTNGFTTNSLVLLDNVLAAWKTAGASPGVYWPSNANSTWILEKLIARKDGELLAIGLVHPNAAGASEKEIQLRALQSQLPRNGVWLSGWELLGSSVARLVLSDLPKVVIPIFLLVLVSLWLAYRSIRDVLLSFATILFSGLCLVLVMHFAGLSWNMMNLMSLPLLLGMGVDFSIHIQLALRKHNDLDFVRRSIGRALLLAGSTTVAGFASLAFSSNSGIASLGAVCGVGITISMLVAVYLLPVWWKAIGRAKGLAAGN